MLELSHKAFNFLRAETERQVLSHGQASSLLNCCLPPVFYAALPAPRAGKLFSVTPVLRHINNSAT